MTVGLASVTTLTASCEPLRLEHTSRWSQSDTWASSSGWKTRSFKRHTRTRTRTRLGVSTTHMLVTGAEANPRRSNWTPNVHRRLSEVCLCSFCPLCLLGNTQKDHTQTHARVHITRALPPRVGRRNREVWRCCWGVMTGRALTHARWQTRVCTHKGTVAVKRSHAHTAKARVRESRKAPRTLGLLAKR